MYRFNHPSLANTRPEQKPEQSRSISWKKALAISALPLAFLFGAAFQSPNSVPGQLQAIQSQLSALQAQLASLANKGPRKFYLTKTDMHNGAQALSACAEGYHMASLWEIHDPSNLQYDTELGFTLDDSGFGPPADLGWIRTGVTANGNSTPGLGNCRAWTSANPGDYGSTVRLYSTWAATSVTVVSPWVAEVRPCDQEAFGWCVQD